MEELIACCGLDCGKCDARNATIENDDELRKTVAKKWSELNDVQILPQQINCLGCRTQGVKTVFCEQMCDVRKCNVKKGYESCRVCKERAQCPKLLPFKDSPDVRKNLCL